ncbi:MAG: hypothetical protein QOH06_1301 [Acidobacteriota bacterium]|jgi:hypothetical protein|nr:hypothetical protein [Acidobacteriota bacterium]
MRKICSVLVSLAALGLAGCTQSARTADMINPVPPSALHKAAIQQALLHDTYEGTGVPEPIKLEQIALDSVYALATWTRGETGGQALLRWEEGSWKVLINEPGWLGLRRLSQEGVPDVVCRSLLEQIDPNWASYETF